MTREEKVELLKAIKEGALTIDDFQEKSKPDFSKLSKLELLALLQYIRYKGNTEIMVNEVKDVLPGVLAFIKGEQPRPGRPDGNQLEWHVQWEMHQRMAAKENEAIKAGINIKRTAW